MLKAEEDLLTLVEDADVMLYERMGFVRLDKNTQMEIIVDDLMAHIDFLGLYSDKKAIVDIKYTETVADDRWNGWGDPEAKLLTDVQATHYTYVMFKQTGEYLPFYFVVFGKSGWVKLIKVEQTEENMQRHVMTLDNFRETFKRHDQEGWKAHPEYNKCIKCPFREDCEFKSLVPEEQIIQL